MAKRGEEVLEKNLRIVFPYVPFPIKMDVEIFRIIIFIVSLQFEITKRREVV